MIFLTDGRPTIGETRPDKILERLDGKAGKARVFCFGIGTDINTKLLDLVAEKTRAVTEYVLPEEDIEHKVSRFYSKIAVPVMANLKLSTRGGVRLKQMYPRDLPDLFKGDQLVVFGRYSGAGEKGKAKVELEGTLAGDRRSFEYRVKLKGTRENRFIPRLWSTRRVGYLLDEIRLRGESKELKDEVVQLARKYGIVTPYTSYLIVEDEVARNVPLASQSMGRRHRGLDERAADAVTPADPEAPAAGGAGRNFGLHTESLRKADQDAFAELAEEETGDGAVAAARASAELKKATTAGATRAAFRESQYPAEGGTEQLAQETRLIAGKSFYKNGGEWIDSEAQALEGAEAIEIEFGSEQYFELLAQSNQTARWLSVGDSIQVVIGGKLYRIVPAK